MKMKANNAKFLNTTVSNAMLYPNNSAKERN